MPKKKDLTGLRFGRLTVLKELPLRKNGSVVWECQCDCGNIINVSSGNLTRCSRPTQSCGCLKQEQNIVNLHLNDLEDLTGQTFNFLQVIEQIPLNNFTDEQKQKFHRSRVWKCKCLLCGNEIITTSEALKSNNTKSCGCLVSQGEQAISKILKQENIPYKSQVKFKDCVDIHELPFDFGIYNNNELLYLIEFDGEQHFLTEPRYMFTEEKIQKIKYHDNLKNKYCLTNNITLYRIPYYDLNKLKTFQDLIKESYLVTKEKQP